MSDDLLTNDRFAPPRAEVADIHNGGGEVQPVKLWSAKGRIGRVRLLAYYAYSYFLFLLTAGVAGAVIGALSVGLGGALGDASSGAISEIAITAVTVLLAIPYAIFITLIVIQRSHDMDGSGWMMLLAIIPFVGLIWLVKAGTPGNNRFGAPPPPNTLAVKIGAWLLPVLIVAIIIASVAMESFVR